MRKYTGAREALPCKGLPRLPRACPVSRPGAYPKTHTAADAMKAAAAVRVLQRG